MSRKRRTPKMSHAELIEIRLLRLAAAAVDLRDQLTPRQIAETPGLLTALEACDVLFDELGWGPLGVSGYSDEAGHFLNGRSRTYS